MGPGDVVDQIISADILVAGAETSGGTAAIAASENSTLRILVLTKGQDVGRSGATMLAYQPHSSCVIDSKSAHEQIGLKLGDPRDSQRAFFEDMLACGDYVNDQESAMNTARNAAKVGKKITEWGFEWDMDTVDRSSGHRFPRDYYGLKPWGHQYAQLLGSLIRHRSNVELMPDSMAVDILTSNGKVSGVVIFNFRTGGLTLCRCKAVILACGGAQNLFRLRDSGRELTGDAYGMAFRAGASLLDLEFVMFQMLVVWPDIPAHNLRVLRQVFRHTALLYNRLGQRFMQRWDPVNMEKNRYLGQVALAQEVIEGRGGKYDGVYFSIGHLPKNLIDYQAEWGHLKGWVDAATHFDYSGYVERLKNGEAFEISLGAHYNEGGIKVSQPSCMTEIQGLYAVGEAAGGAEGGRRVGGDGLTNALVQGYMAAADAVEYVKRSPQEEINMEKLRKIRDEVYAPLKAQGGISPVEIRNRIQNAASAGVWAVRNERTLTTALSIAEATEKDMERMYVSTKGPEYNLELIESLEVRNLLLSLKLMATAALIRKESRGHHYRTDHPDTDNDNWLKSIVLSKAGDGGVASRIEPVSTPYLRPPAGVHRYAEFILEVDNFRE